MSTARLLSILIVCCVSGLGAAQDNGPLTNGSFELNGGTGSSDFTGWTVSDQDGSSGSWYVQSGSALPGVPAGACATGSAPSPTAGSFAAMTSQASAGAHFLSQDFTVPAGGGTLKLDVSYQSSAALSAPDALDFKVRPNQQFRVDLLKQSASLTDTGTGVVLDVFSAGPDLSSGGYVAVSASLAAFAGQRLKLRLVEVDTEGCLTAAVDNVRIEGAACPTISLTPATLQPAVVGSAYTVTLGASGGTGPYTFTATGSVPPGLGLSAAGVFGGVPIAAGAFSFTVTAKDARGCAGSSNLSLVVSGCPAPGAPSLSTALNSLTSGQSVVVSWTAAAGLADAGSYVLETSRDHFASAPEASQTTTSMSTVIPTNVSAIDFTLSVRVRAVQPCGTLSASSNTLDVRFSAALASFVVTQTGPSWSALVGDAPPSGIIRLRNVGAVPGHLSLSASASFLSVFPESLDVPPGEERAATVQATADAMRSAGVRSGLVAVAYGSTQISTPVTLTVTPRAAATGARVTAPGSITFSAPPGGSPPPQALTLEVSPVGAEPVYLVPAIGPGGAWLQVSSNVGDAVPLSGRTTISLSVDRSKRSAQDGTSPFRTLLTITPVGGDPSTDAAVIEILDVDTLAVKSGSGSRGGTGGVRAQAATAPPGGTSFIVPVVVKAVSGLTGQRFTTDGWLRNVGGAPAPVQLFFTPEGKDGLSDPGVLETDLVIRGGSTFRLSDLLANVFHVDATSGQIEVRSSMISSLTMRATVDSISSSGDPTTRFGTEIPTVSYGSGIGSGQGELVIPGVDDDATNRANIVLAETTGAAATARITVNRPDGSLLAELRRDVPPYGKVQITRVVDAVVPGATLSGGWVGISVVAGAGRVVAIATVIDNRSGSFSAVLGKSPKSGLQSAERDSAALALVAPVTYLLPTVVRTVGQFDTRFVTSLRIVNGVATQAAVDLTYLYVDQDDEGRPKLAHALVTLPPRGSLPKTSADDVIANVFHVTNRSYGSIVIGGDARKIVATASVSAQVDPKDPLKGLKSAQVNAYSSDAPQLMSLGRDERRFAGAEKSVQKRTNLILLETVGRPASIVVRAYSATGEKLAERTLDVLPNEYKQVTDVFGDDGVRLGAGPFQNVEVTAQVVSGTGLVLAAATVNDNISRNPEILVLESPAPPPNPTITF